MTEKEFARETEELRDKGFEPCWVLSAAVSSTEFIEEACRGKDYITLRDNEKIHVFIRGKK